MKHRHVYTIALLLLVATLPTAAIAQQPPTCIDTAASHLHFDSTSSTMQAFFGRWQSVEQTGQGSLNIVHIGGSHVQAGILSNTLRQRLIEATGLPAGARGLIFPYSAAAKCNNPPDYRIHCPQPVLLTRNVYKEHTYPLGACGIAVTAHSQPTEVQVVLADSQICYRTNRIVLLGHSNQSVIPRLHTDSGDVYPSYIDRHTDRYVFNLQAPTDSFALLLPCAVGDTFTVCGIYLDNRSPGVSLHSIGVNGAAVPDYLRCTNFVRDMRLLHPDAVVFGIGINDAVPTNFDTAQFRLNYLRLIDSVRSVNPDCAIIFVTNNDSYRKTGRRRYSVNTNGELVRQVFYRLAAEVGGAVWDQYSVMGGLKSMDKWYKAGYARVDRVHFTAVGYRLVGNMLADAIIEAYRNTCKQ